MPHVQVEPQPCDLSHDAFDVTKPPSHEQKDARENISFPQFRLRAVTMTICGSTKCLIVSLALVGVGAFPGTSPSTSQMTLDFMEISESWQNRIKGWRPFICKYSICLWLWLEIFFNLIKKKTK